MLPEKLGRPTLVVALDLTSCSSVPRFVQTTMPPCDTGANIGLKLQAESPLDEQLPSSRIVTFATVVLPVEGGAQAWDV